MSLMSYRRGFSTIELMISVAIVAIFAVLAFPAYQDYVLRSRKSEGLILATAAKNVVAENAATLSADLGLGYVGLANPTRNVRVIQVNSLNGIVTVELGEAAGGGQLLLTPSVSGAALVAGRPASSVIEWRCTGSGPAMRLPTECR